jgi:uridine kinase
MKGIYTIAIAGISGAGKSVAVNGVAEKLEDSTILHFNDFRQDYNLLTKF